MQTGVEMIFGGGELAHGSHHPADASQRKSCSFRVRDLSEPIEGFVEQPEGTCGIAAFGSCLAKA
jgi:hypothetical protein